ncbi:hypothetical protein N7468_007620 [Penicillium chermesinum]|uniref:Uncharacterized protein n=1 Tax=Penicillium chermesinum TaxID=63820 RepID=A0A9W9NUG4_9EURO|nr:uncharacterized protein N7468_007620 [Penicillium chermesinum]KAJ5226395.1 hypothetical protein N7468_007620 [Penicillium chermesinum]
MWQDVLLLVRELKYRVMSLALIGILNTLGFCQVNCTLGLEKGNVFSRRPHYEDSDNYFVLISVMVLRLGSYVDRV